MRRCRWSAALAVLLLGTALAGAADLTKIDRTIAKEPAYKSKPKYCLLVFGPEAKTRAWLVVDGDLVFIDRYHLHKLLLRPVRAAGGAPL